MSTNVDVHNVRKGTTIIFADGEERTIFPLTIKGLRKFVKVLETLQLKTDMTELNDEDIDRMMDAAQIIMEKVDPELATDRDALEDAIDLISFNRIMTVAMGNSSPEE